MMQKNPENRHFLLYFSRKSLKVGLSEFSGNPTTQGAIK